MKRLTGICVIALALCCCLAIGCSSSSTSASASSSASASASSAASTASASSDAASSSSAASFSADAASVSSAASNDFDRAVVGTWHIYEADFAHEHDGGRYKFDAETVALLRKYGLHETLTIFSDGTFIWSGDTKGTWTQKDNNVLALTVSGDTGSVDLTLKDSRLTLVVADVATIVYARG